MSRQVWRYESLARNTKLIKEFCAKYNFDYKEFTPYQFRIEGLIDVNDLKRVILERMPEAPGPEGTNV